MKKIIIDNFLEEEYFNTLQKLFTGPDFTWYYTSNVVYGGEDTYHFFLTHMLYDFNVALSPHFDILIPLLEKIETENAVRSLVRIRVNFFPHTQTIYEHPMHVDKDFECSAVVLSLNTCNGYTRLEEDDSKVESIANRALFMDAGKRHCSSTTTDEKVRFNLTVTYL